MILFRYAEKMKINGCNFISFVHQYKRSTIFIEFICHTLVTNSHFTNLKPQLFLPSVSKEITNERKG